MGNHSIEFFDIQFQRQIRESDFALNPFEKLALPYLSGQVLDLGCGLGNLSIEAARRGCSLLALDGSASAIEHINNVSGAEGLPIRADLVDLETYNISGEFDVIVSIGLLMFMRQSRAYEMLEQIQSHVRPGGLSIVNVLIEGTTYLNMFEPDNYYLFGRDELLERFAGWEILERRYDNFEAPGATVKQFVTVVGRKL